MRRDRRFISARTSFRCAGESRGSMSKTRNRCDGRGLPRKWRKPGAVSICPPATRSVSEALSEGALALRAAITEFSSCGWRRACSASREIIVIYMPCIYAINFGQIARSERHHVVGLRALDADRVQIGPLRILLAYRSAHHPAKEHGRALRLGSRAFSVVRSFR